MLRSSSSLVGSSDHGVSLSLYAKDPDGLEFEVFWTVPPQSWRVLYQSGGQWKPVEARGEYGRQTNTLRRLSDSPGAGDPYGPPISTISTAGLP